MQKPGWVYVICRAMVMAQSTLQQPEKVHFTVDEVNQRLPLVKRIVNDILQTGRELEKLRNQPDVPDTGQHVRRLTADLRAFIKELEDLGGFYKDWQFEIGLVDFPGEINGRQVLLCWRGDEDSVSHYHGMDDGYQGRKKIPAQHLES